MAGQIHSHKRTRLRGQNISSVDEKLDTAIAWLVCLNEIVLNLREKRKECQEEIC